MNDDSGTALAIVTNAYMRANGHNGVVAPFLCCFYRADGTSQTFRPRNAATLRALLTLLDPDDVALSVDVDTEDFHEVWATIWPRRPQGVTLQ